MVRKSAHACEQIESSLGREGRHQSTISIVNLTTMDNGSCNSKSGRNSCSCVDCLSRNCYTRRRHQEASLCTCDRCVNSKTCLYFNKDKSQDKLKQIYNASQGQFDKNDKLESINDYIIKKLTESMETLKNKQMHSIPNELHDEISKRGNNKISKHNYNPMSECETTCPSYARPVKIDCEKECPKCIKENPDQNRNIDHICAKDTVKREKYFPENNDQAAVVQSTTQVVVQTKSQVLCFPHKEKQENGAILEDTQPVKKCKKCDKILKKSSTGCLTQRSKLVVDNPDKDKKDQEATKTPEDTQPVKKCKKCDKILKKNSTGCLTQRSKLVVDNPDKDKKDQEATKTPEDIQPKTINESKEGVFINKSRTSNKSINSLVLQVSKKDKKDEVIITTPENKNEDVLTCNRLHKQDQIARCKKCNKRIKKNSRASIYEKIIFGEDGGRKRNYIHCCHHHHHKNNKTMAIGKDNQVQRNHIRPAFCPTCHKIFIEEQNKEHNRTKIILNECPECQKASLKVQGISAYKTPCHTKCFDLHEIEKYYQHKNNVCEDAKEDKVSNHTPCHKNDQLGEQGTVSDDLSSTKLIGNILTLMKECGSQKQNDTQAKITNQFDNVNPKTKYEVPVDDKTPLLLMQCSLMNKSSQLTNSCEKHKQINICCPTQNLKQNQMKSLQKCHAEVVSISTQTEYKTPEALRSDYLPLAYNNNDIMAWIKKCVHKELKDACNFLPNIIDNPEMDIGLVNYEHTENDDELSSTDKFHPSKQSHNRNNSCAFYDKIKDYLKYRFSTSNKTDACQQFESAKSQTSEEVQEVINETKRTINLIGHQLPESQKVKIHSCKNKRNALQLAGDRNRGQHNIVLEYGTNIRNERKMRKHEEREVAANDLKTFICHTYKTPADELSAKIMDVPYTKYKQSIQSTVTRPSYYTNEKILNIINQIYKTCSCKVCECVSKSPNVTEGEVCNCKPCGCIECSGQRENCKSIDCYTRINNTKVLQCAASDKCECKICKCIECREQSYQKSCNCKPCDCIKCNNLLDKHMNNRQTNFIVAPVTPVGERQERPYCQCSPCGCFECAHPLGTLAPTHYNQETGTDERRHMNCSCNHCNNDQCEEQGIDTCSCDRHSKLMRKPVANNKDEYDIHYCITGNHNIRNYEYIYNKKRSPVIIYMSLTQSFCYPRTKAFVNSTCNSLRISSDSNNISHMNSRTINVSILPQKYWALRRNAHLMSKTINQCDCKPCECHKCKKHYLEGHIPYRQSNCSCEICDCINCATLSVFYQMKDNNNIDKWAYLHKTEQKCNCQPCNCKHCSIYTDKIVQNESDNLKHDASTTPLVRKATSDNFSAYCDKVSDSKRYIDHVLTNQESRYCNTFINKSNLSEVINREKLQKKEYHIYCNRDLIVKTSIEGQSSMLSHKKQSYKRKEIDTTKNCSQMLNHTEGSDSTVSSSITSLPYSHINNSVSKEPKEHKSIRRTSSTSSGYDYSDYLIPFPTSTVETCIKDVMSLLYNKPDKDFLKLSPTSKPIEEYSESSISTLHYQKELSILGEQSSDTLQLGDACKTCKIGKFDNSCDCKPCGCDKCCYKMPKLKRCLCDCASCRCDGTCLSEKKSVLIRKNDTTQTSIFASGCGEMVTKELSSQKLRKAIVTFSDNNEILKWTEFPMPEFKYSTSNKDMDNLLTANYESAQRTIREAKQFSLELLHILQKYEKANKDFDRMSERYKSFHKSIRCENDDQNNFSEQPNNYHIAFIKTMPYQNNTNIEKSIIKFEEGSLKSNKLSKIFNNEKSSHMIGIHTSTFETAEQNTLKKRRIKADELSTLEENDIKTDEKKILLKEEVKADEQNISQENYIKTDEPNIFEDDINSPNKETSRPSLESSKEGILQEVGHASNDDQTQIDSFNCAKVADHEGKSYLEKLKSEFKKYSIQMDEVIKKRSETVWKNKTNVIDNRNKENTTTSKYSTTISKLDGFLYQIPPIKEFTNTEKSSDLNSVFNCQSQEYHEPHRNNEKLPRILNIEQLNSLKKFIIPETKETDNNNSGSSETDHHLVQQCSATRYVYTQGQRPFGSSTSTPRIASKRFELSPSRIRSATIKTDAINTFNCNPFKVVFQTVKKVSEHSILLKWKIPDNITDVEGYEIQVNGRSIQRILNPARNMAVLTCLPHAEKVQITVRTITKMADDGHTGTPCTTITFSNRF